MSDWQEKARELLPELTDDIDEANSPMGLWHDIWFEFEQAYETEPRDEDLIRRVYAFADWCLQHAERGETADFDPFTCVAVCFLELLPAHSATRADMPRWFTQDEVALSKDVYGHHLSDEEFEQLLDLLPPEKPIRKHRKKRSR